MMLQSQDLPRLRRHVRRSELEPAEITAIVDALAPRLAEILEHRLSERPELAMSIPEAAAYVRVDEATIRSAIKAGRLPVCRIGHQVRIKRSDLFRVRGSEQ